MFEHTRSALCGRIQSRPGAYSIFGHTDHLVNSHRKRDILEFSTALLQCTLLGYF